MDRYGRITSGGFYVRVGRNFSPDRLTRASWGKIGRWAKRFDFKRAQLNHLWGEMLLESNESIPPEVHMPELRTLRCDQEESLRMERNGAGISFVDAAEAFRTNIKFLETRRDRVANQFCDRYEYGPYVGGDIELGGPAKAEAEVVDFRQ